MIEYARVLEHRRKDGIGIEQEDGSILVGTREAVCHGSQAVVVVCDVKTFERDCFSAVRRGCRRMVDRWYIQEEEVSRPDGVQLEANISCAVKTVDLFRSISYLLNQTPVHNEDIPIERCIPLPIRDINIVDAKENGEQTIIRRPGCCILLHIIRDKLIVNLLTKVHSRQERRDQIGRNNSTPETHIVRLKKALIVRRRQEIHPVGPIT